MANRITKDYILNICGPANEGLNMGAVSEAVFGDLSARGPIRILAPYCAEIPIHFSAIETPHLIRHLRKNFHADVNLVPDGDHRRKKLFLADMDSTMIEQECIDELAEMVGLKSKVSAITERAMQGEIAFEPALRERVALLRGLPVSVIDTIIAGRITLTPGGAALVSTMKVNGAYTCLVSGGFTLFTSRIAAMLGFDEHRANGLIVVDGKLTGEVREPILGKEAKRATLIELRHRLGLQPQDTLAVGDGANDLAMLGEAGLGIAFKAKPAVAAAAHASIVLSDLRALLHLQGYSASEIANG